MSNQSQNQTCTRCGNTWAAEVETPVKCPKCKSTYWNKPRKYKLRSRPDAVPVAPRHPGRWIRADPDKRHGVSLADLLEVLKDCEAELPIYRRELQALEKIARAAFRSSPESS